MRFGIIAASEIPCWQQMPEGRVGQQVRCDFEGSIIMRTKLLVLGALVAAVALMGTNTASADHWRSGCNSGYSSYGYGYNSYSFSPGYSYGYRGYATPSYGFSVARPGFSLSIGSGYYRPQYYNYGGYGWGSNFQHRHHHHHHH